MNTYCEYAASTKWTILHSERGIYFDYSVLWYMYFLCPAKDHVVIDLNIKLGDQLGENGSILSQHHLSRYG